MPAPPWRALRLAAPAQTRKPLLAPTEDEAFDTEQPSGCPPVPVPVPWVWVLGPASGSWAPALGPVAHMAPGKRCAVAWNRVGPPADLAPGMGCPAMWQWLAAVAPIRRVMPQRRQRTAALANGEAFLVLLHEVQLLCVDPVACRVQPADSA